MLNIIPPDYKYCPMCSTQLTRQDDVARFSKFCFECGWAYYPHVAGAAAAVIMSEGRVLLIKRKDEPYKNTWMFPAGFINFGETPEETAIREVKEETGLDIFKLRLIDVLQNPDDPRSVGHFGFFYRTDSFTGKIEEDSSEVSEIGWFKLDNLPEIGWESHKKILFSLKIS